MAQATRTYSNTVRDILRSSGKLGKDIDLVTETDDLYDAGLSSHASVSVMLGLEEELDIEFPDQLLRKSTFASVQSIVDALETIEKDINS